jgi:hypothetical protein
MAKRPILSTVFFLLVADWLILNLASLDPKNGLKFSQSEAGCVARYDFVEKCRIFK